MVRLPRNEKQTYWLNSRPQMWPMVWIYQIVTGVTSVVGVPSTHLVWEIKMNIKLVCHYCVSVALLWCHNGHNSVSNHQRLYCLLNRFYEHRSKKTSKLRVTGLCAGNSPGTSKFPVTRKMFPFDDVIMAFGGTGWPSSGVAHAQSNDQEQWQDFCFSVHGLPDSKVHGANMGPIWGRQDPGGPHVGPMNLAIWATVSYKNQALLS